MKLVNSKKQIEDNCIHLSKQIENVEHIEEIKNLIRRGRCFVKYFYNDKIYFFPSKFVGYQKNTITKYNLAKRSKKNFDGRHTNKKIKKILGKKFKTNFEINNEYIKFCNKLDIEPTKVKRKYVIL